MWKATKAKLLSPTKHCFAPLEHLAFPTLQTVEGAKIKRIITIPVTQHQLGFCGASSVQFERLIPDPSQSKEQDRVGPSEG